MFRLLLLSFLEELCLGGGRDGSPIRVALVGICANLILSDRQSIMESRLAGLRVAPVDSRASSPS